MSDVELTIVKSAKKKPQMIYFVYVCATNNVQFIEVVFLNSIVYCSKYTHHEIYHFHHL